MSITEEIVELFDDNDDDSPLVAKMPHVKDALTVTKKQGAADDWHSFKPMCFMATYKDLATKTEHVVVVIIVPSGMCHGNLLKCHLQVEEDGKKLIFSSQWPAYSMEMEVLHCKLESKLGKFAQGTDIHNIWKHSEALSDVLALMHASEQEVLSSTCPITLSIQVSHKSNNIELLGSHNDRSHIIYTDLKAEESTYHAMEIPKAEFMDELSWVELPLVNCHAEELG